MAEPAVPFLYGTCLRLLNLPEASENEDQRLTGKMKAENDQIRSGGTMKIVLISGSFRKNSFNTDLLELAKEALEKEGVETEVLHYQDLQLFSVENTYPFTPEAEKCRQAVKEADAMWIFCPEYNGSYPGVLKNLLDYLSLTWIENDYASGSPLIGKLVTYSGAGGKGRTASAGAILIDLLRRCGCVVMESPLTQVAVPSQAFTARVWTPDAEVAKEIDEQAKAFVIFVKEHMKETR